ncbi:MAG: hypothetical protein H6Q33_5 [Deltaproteobacteria bacterium]|nr:hypothetical protein [Deltaproteobacteria bacterium]
MRKIVAGLFMSLDGVVDSPASSPHEWTNTEMAEWMADGIAQADSVLLGARSYLLLAEFWRHQGNDLPMARFLNRSPKYVLSASVDTLDWQPAALIRGNLREELTTLKGQPGKNIQVPGSPRLVRWLLCNGLLDELRLAICPVVVGPGMRLFDEISKQITLTLMAAKTASNGVVVLTYQPARSNTRAAA